MSGVLGALVRSRSRELPGSFRPVSCGAQGPLPRIPRLAGPAPGRGGDRKSLQQAAGTLGLEGRLGAPVREAPSSPPPASDKL